MARHARRKTATKTRRKTAHRKTARKWSAKETETSDAMTLQDKVFTKSPAAIARSLKR